MKVLLISPNTEQINMPVLPLGMAYVGAAAHNAGHEVKMVNLMMANQDIKTILEKSITDFVPQVIGISVRNIDDQDSENTKFLLDPVKKVIAECRSLSDVPVVLGGAGYSIFPQSALNYLGADMGIQGEGETPFVMLLERLEQHSEISSIPGLCLPGTGFQEKVRFSQNLNQCQIPLPNIHLSLPPALKDQQVWVPFQTRRGCPMDCSYCSTATIEGRIIRKQPPEKVIEAITRYVEAGFDHFFFTDNTFNFPPSYAKTLCDLIISRKLNISWRCILYPHLADESLIKKMAIAGCKEISLGFESGSIKILRKMNKRFDPDEVRQISDLFKSFDIKRMGFLMLGGPGETKDTAEETLTFADSLNLDALKVKVGIRIYPFTLLSRIAVQECLIRSEDELLFPKFYVVKEIEQWLKNTLNKSMENRANWMK